MPVLCAGGRARGLEEAGGVRLRARQDLGAQDGERRVGIGLQRIMVGFVGLG